MTPSLKYLIALGSDEQIDTLKTFVQKRRQESEIEI